MAASLKKVYQTVNRLVKKGKVLAAYTPGYGGVAEGILKMSLGNGIGLAFDPGCTLDELFSYAYGSFILELTDNQETIGLSLGTTTETGDLTWNGQTLTAQELLAAYEGKLEPIYPCNIPQGEGTIPTLVYESDSWKKPLIKAPQPRVLIPVFPGTNCEYDAAKAMAQAGAVPEIVVIKNLTAGTSPSPWTWWPKSWPRPRWSSSQAASPAATSPTARPSSSPPSSGQRS